MSSCSATRSSTTAGTCRAGRPSSTTSAEFCRPGGRPPSSPGTGPSPRTSSGSWLARLPADATHLVVSAGGNDALGSRPALPASPAAVDDLLDALADLHAAFQ